MFERKNKSGREKKKKKAITYKVTGYGFIYILFVVLRLISLQIN